MSHKPAEPGNPCSSCYPIPWWALVIVLSRHITYPVCLQFEKESNSCWMMSSMPQKSVMLLYLKHNSPLRHPRSIIRRQICLSCCSIQVFSCLAFRQRIAIKPFCFSVWRNRCKREQAAWLISASIHIPFPSPEHTSFSVSWSMFFAVPITLQALYHLGMHYP